MQPLTWSEHLDSVSGNCNLSPCPKTWKSTQVGLSQSNKLAVKSLLFTADWEEGEIKEKHHRPSLVSALHYECLKQSYPFPCTGWARWEAYHTWGWHWGIWGHGWVDGWCSVFLSMLKLTALLCDRESGNDWGRLDTAVTLSTILYKEATMNVSLMAGWVRLVARMHIAPPSWAAVLLVGCSIKWRGGLLDLEYFSVRVLDNGFINAYCRWIYMDAYVCLHTKG